MRKLTAIICLAAFFALQYGKLVSYWHCRLSTASTAVRCDCEKQLLDVHENGTTHSNTAAIAKEKTEETYLGHEISYSCQPPLARITHTPAYLLSMPEVYSHCIFQPPRI